ncbi:MAG: hypothetical protein ISN29_01445 [Gammaproteobacteria bacterium AqS3]|nr:hypothetical protein [Gammaproteobacteria bacterium AqS3]
MKKQNTPGTQDADTPTPTPQDLRISEFIEACKQQGRAQDLRITEFIEACKEQNRIQDLRITEFIEANKNQFASLQVAIEENKKALDENKEALDENKEALVAHDRQCIVDKTTMNARIDHLEAQIKAVKWQLWAVIAPIYGGIVIYAIRALFS